MQAGIDFTARCMAAEALANGGSGGTSDYTQLTNKPSINNVELSGNKTSANLGLQAEITGNVTISSDNVDDTGATNLFVTTSEKSTWNDKQDALAFDGIYNASTNKVATESTVYNEAANATLASGYTADSSEVNITSATNINDAIEQLDYRTTTNKTNILYNTNNGVKNLAPLNAATTANTGYFGTTSVNLPADTYIISFKLTSTGSFGLGITVDGSAISKNSTSPPYSNTLITHEITANTSITEYKFYANGGATVTDFMICPKSLYDADPTYQPYALSNAEITAWILAHS